MRAGEIILDGKPSILQTKACGHNGNAFLNLDAGTPELNGGYNVVFPP
jgi:hypothetical protein